MMKNKNEIDIVRSKWYLSAIIGTVIVPLGMLLAVINTVIDYKTRTERNEAVFYSALGLSIFAVYSSGLFLFVGALTGLGYSGILKLIIILAAGLIEGIYLFIVYYCQGKRLKTFTFCYNLIAQSHITSVDKLAEISGKSIPRTKRIIKNLIKRKWLDGAEIDDEHNEVVFKRSVWAKQKVVCNNCGAQIIVDYGQTLVCEYCGGALSVKSVE